MAVYNGKRPRTIMKKYEPTKHQRLDKALAKFKDNKLVLKNKWIGAIYITYAQEVFMLRDKDMYSVMPISLDTVEHLIKDMEAQDE